MKLAILNATGARDIPLLTPLLNRQHHVAYVAPSPLPIAVANANPPATRFEHHHIDFKETRQLVSAFQSCDAAILCENGLPFLSSADHLRIRMALEQARVPHLIRLNIDHIHPRTADKTNPLNLIHPFILS
ncbi:MAG: hypothetical protein AAGD22_14495 [Verrucomicrobiota bacterium]